MHNKTVLRFEISRSKIVRLVKKSHATEIKIRRFVDLCNKKSNKDPARLGEVCGERNVHEAQLKGRNHMTLDMMWKLLLT